MKLRLLFILLLSLLSSLAQASFFYKVSKNGHTSYVLGSIHYGVSPNELHPQIQELHRDSQLHFYEMAFHPQTVNEYLSFGQDPQRFLNSEFYGPPAQPGELLDPASVERAVSYGVPRNIAEKLKNSHCTAFAARKYFFTGKSVDFELQSQTYQQGRTPQVLDSPQLLQKSFELASKEPGGDENPLINCNLRELLKDPKKIKEMDDAMEEYIQSYKEGNPETFAATQDSALAWYRNQEWANILAPKLSRYNSFITVGGAHLHGERGLLNLLRQKGFAVEDMSLSSLEEDSFDEPPLDSSH